MTIEHPLLRPQSIRESVSTGRHETADERLDRNLSELVQELRVAGLGVQVLFGFMLALPFSARFVRLSSTERGIYLADVAMTAVSIALLGGPVAYHRLAFRRHAKERILRIANVMAVIGMVTVAAAVSLAVWLIVTFVDTSIGSVLLAGLVAMTFVGLWFLLPLATRPHGHAS